MSAALAKGNEFYLGVSGNMVPKYTSAWPVLWLEWNQNLNEGSVYVPYSGEQCSKYMWADTCIASINDDMFSKGRAADGTPTWYFPFETLRILFHLAENANNDEDTVACVRSENDNIDEIISVEQFQFAVELVKPLWLKVSVPHLLFNSTQAKQIITQTIVPKKCVF